MFKNINKTVIYDIEAILIRKCMKELKIINS